MNTTEQILLIILSAFLAIFLGLGIALIVGITRLVKKVNAVADSAQEIIEKAHDIADKVENVSDIFKKSAGPLALGRTLMNMVETVIKHKKEK